MKQPDALWNEQFFPHSRVFALESSATQLDQGQYLIPSRQYPRPVPKDYHQLDGRRFSGESTAKVGGEEMTTCAPKITRSITQCFKRHFGSKRPRIPPLHPTNAPTTCVITPPIIYHYTIGHNSVVSHLNHEPGLP